MNLNIRPLKQNSLKPSAGRGCHGPLPHPSLPIVCVLGHWPSVRDRGGQMNPEGQVQPVLQIHLQILLFRTLNSRHHSFYSLTWDANMLRKPCDQQSDSYTLRPNWLLSIRNKGSPRLPSVIDRKMLALEGLKHFLLSFRNEKLKKKTRNYSQKNDVFG